MDLIGSMQAAGGVGGLLAVTDGTASYYPTYDGNGNISEYLDSGGTTQAHYEYDAFGNETVKSGAKANDFAHRFSTKPQDTESGLYYYGYRYYDPVTGRFINRDPIQEGGGFNTYGFINNNTVNDFDLLGLTSVKECFKRCDRYVGIRRQVCRGRCTRNSNKGDSGNVSPFYSKLQSAAMAFNFSYSNSTPIGAIGPVTFNLSFSVSGSMQKCCTSDGGEDVQAVGTFTIGVDGGVGAVVGPGGGGSQQLPGSSAGGGSGTGGGIQITPGGGLPACETKWNKLSYSLEAQFVVGVGGVWGVSASKTIAECDSAFNCNWTFDKPATWGAGDGGTGARMQITASASVGFQYYPRSK